jgi:hypothetical protein
VPWLFVCVLHVFVLWRNFRCTRWPSNKCSSAFVWGRSPLRPPGGTVALRQSHRLLDVLISECRTEHLHRFVLHYYSQEPQVLGGVGYREFGTTRTEISWIKIYPHNWPLRLNACHSGSALMDSSCTIHQYHYAATRCITMNNVSLVKTKSRQKRTFVCRRDTG